MGQYPAHRHGDERLCTATTVVTGQTTVFVNGKLWAVKDDQNTHGAGQLIPSGNSVYINNKLVIVHKPDNALADNSGHLPATTKTNEGSGDVFAHGAITVDGETTSFQSDTFQSDTFQ